MVPGIDLAGVSQTARHADCKAGDKVVLNGWGVGESALGRPGAEGAAERRLADPAAAGVHRRQAMAIGTAGYTAALCVEALVNNGVTPEQGEVLVTGATGGVGSVADRAAHEGRLPRASRPPARASEDDYLKQLGASEHHRSRRRCRAAASRCRRSAGPAWSTRSAATPWPMPAPQTRYGGDVAACGLAQGMDFPASVAPFILRGVSLLGIDSVMAPRAPRLAAWERLASDLDGAALEVIAEEVALGEAVAEANRLLRRQGARSHRCRRQSLNGSMTMVARSKTTPAKPRTAAAKPAARTAAAKTTTAKTAAAKTPAAKTAAAKPKVTRATKAKPAPQLDLTDVDHRVGKPIGGGQLWEPCTATDIRRWVMAMDYPNPIHWDEEFARKSKFGGMVAPQSMAVGLDYGHGASPACVGYIPGSHLIFGGEEWWFYGTRIRPGDTLKQERRFHDYKVTDTNFAGPTMFSRGDTAPLQPAWLAGRQGAGDRHPLSRRRGGEARHVREHARRNQALDSGGDRRHRQRATRLDHVES